MNSHGHSTTPLGPLGARAAMGRRVQAVTLAANRAFFRVRTLSGAVHGSALTLPESGAVRVAGPRAARPTAPFVVSSAGQAWLSLHDRRWCYGRRRDRWLS